MSLEALSSLAAYCFEEIQKNVKIATHEILRHFLKVWSCYDNVWQMTSLQDNIMIFSSCVKYFFTLFGSFNRQAPVVQKVDNAIHRINHYPLDTAIGFAITYPVDSAIHRLNNWGLNIKAPKTD